MNDAKNTRLVFIFSIVLIGALSRLVPHPFNFTGIAAIALFSGAKLKNRWLAVSVPVLAMLVTDSVIGFHDPKDMLAVYGCFLMTVVFGMFLGNQPKAGMVAISSLASSILFYLVTNFSVWPGNALYSQDLSGLVSSYIAGIPFFRNQILGDLFYNAIFFSAAFYAERKFPAFFAEVNSAE